MKGRACEVCEEAEAVFRCRLCLRYVCEAHYVADKGVCVVCAENLCMLCGRYLGVGYCKRCGRIVCEDCRVELSPVEYLCVECASSRRSREEPLTP